MRIPRDCFANFVADLLHDICANVSRTFHVLRSSCKGFIYVCASVANLLLQNFGEFTMRKFRDTRTTDWRKQANNLRLSVKLLKLCNICMNVVRHSYECHATVVRQSIMTIAQQRYIFINFRPKFVNLLHNCPFNETAT